MKTTHLFSRFGTRIMHHLKCKIVYTHQIMLSNFLKLRDHEEWVILEFILNVFVTYSIRRLETLCIIVIRGNHGVRELTSYRTHPIQLSVAWSYVPVISMDYSVRPNINTNTGCKVAVDSNRLQFLNWRSNFSKTGLWNWSIQNIFKIWYYKHAEQLFKSSLCQELPRAPFVPTDSISILSIGQNACGRYQLQPQEYCILFHWRKNMFVFKRLEKSWFLYIEQTFSECSVRRAEVQSV